jgi:MscS family membrane protein
MKTPRIQLIALLLACAFVPFARAQSIAQQVEKAIAPTSSAASGSQAELIDPLGRSTPRGTVVGFLQAAQSGNYKAAAQYLQLTKSQRAVQGETLARDLHTLMDRAFTGNVNMISERREGSVQPCTRPRRTGEGQKRRT